jgi:hypothetical protein
MGKLRSPDLSTQKDLENQRFRCYLRNIGGPYGRPFHPKNRPFLRKLQRLDLNLVEQLAKGFGDIINACSSPKTMDLSRGYIRISTRPRQTTDW